MECSSSLDPLISSTTSDLDKKLYVSLYNSNVAIWISWLNNQMQNSPGFFF